MPLTPCDTNCWTIWISWARSFSCSGPFQVTFTPRSSPAFFAPCSTDFQKTWVVPLGMTAMESGGDLGAGLSGGCAKPAALRNAMAAAASVAKEWICRIGISCTSRLMAAHDLLAVAYIGAAVDALDVGLGEKGEASEGHGRGTDLRGLRRGHRYVEDFLGGGAQGDEAVVLEVDGSREVAVAVREVAREALQLPPQGEAGVC